MKRIVALPLAAVALLCSFSANALDQSDAGSDTPTWYTARGEGPFSLRFPQFYLLGGATYNIPTSTSISTTNCAVVDPAFAIGCPPPAPVRTGSIVTPETSAGFSVGVGARIAPALRTSFEYSYEKKHNIHPILAVNGVVNGDGFTAVRSQQFSANLFVDGAGLMRPGAFGRFNPYGMAGVGAAINTMSSTIGFSPPSVTQVSITGGATTTQFLWQAGAGLQYDINRWWAVDLGYRYVDAGKFFTSKTDNILLFPVPVNCAIDCSAFAYLREHRVQLQVVFKLP